MLPLHSQKNTTAHNVSVSVITHKVHAWRGGLLSQPQQPETFGLAPNNPASQVHV